MSRVGQAPLRAGAEGGSSQDAQAGRRRRTSPVLGALVFLVVTTTALAQTPEGVTLGNSGSAPAQAAAAPPAAADSTSAAAAPLQPIPVALLAVPYPVAGEEAAFVPLLVEIGGNELLAQATGDAVVGDLSGQVLDASGTVAASLAQHFEVPLGEPDDPLRRRGLKLFLDLRLTPGAYRLQVTVRNAETGASGSAESAVVVPDFSAGTPVVSAPLFPEPLDRWRTFRQSDADADLPYPFEDSVGAFLPSVRPVVAAAPDQPLHLVLYGGLDPQRLAARATPVGAAAGGKGAARSLPLAPTATGDGALPGATTVLAVSTPARSPPATTCSSCTTDKAARRAASPCGWRRRRRPRHCSRRRSRRRHPPSRSPRRCRRG